MEVFLQALVNGILLGGFYSLMGMGQNIIFGVMNIVNFCHGEMLMVGMYITYVLYTYCEVDPYAALPIVAVLMFDQGALIQSTLITPSLKTKSFTNLLFLTVGLSLLLTNGALVIFGSTYYKIITPYAQTYIPLGPVTIALPRLISFLILIVVAIPLFVTKPYVINIFVLTFYMSTLSMAWNILGGITGQNSLGLAAYMGLGAYVCCLVVTKLGLSPWVAALLDMAVVGVVAGVIFFPSLILRGPYFTLVSIAFAESIRQFIINSEFFGRASGVGLPFGKDSFAQFRFTSKVPYYYVGFIMMVGVYLIMKKIGRSKLGFALRTIREDEDAAAAIGINPTKYKVIAVIISAVIAGMVGFFYVSYIRYIDPDIMIQAKSTEIVLPAVVGGAAYIEGPLIGGLIMIPLSELLRANFAAILPGINMLMYAVVLIVVIRFRPAGILGWYMNSKCKTFIDEKILKKPSLDVLEEYELMADKGWK